MDKKYIDRIVKKLRKVLTQDILERYDNAEYWDLESSVIADILHRLDEDERQEVLKELGA